MNLAEHAQNNETNELIYAIMELTIEERIDLLEAMKERSKNG